MQRLVYGVFFKAQVDINGTITLKGRYRLFTNLTDLRQFVKGKKDIQIKTKTLAAFNECMWDWPTFWYTSQDFKLPARQYSKIARNYETTWMFTLGETFGGGWEKVGRNTYKLTVCERADESVHPLGTCIQVVKGQFEVIASSN